MAKKGNYICEWCGKDCGNPPALNLHQQFCKSRPDKKELEEKKVVNKCEHNYRLLNPTEVGERMAIKDGFIQVCTKCYDLE